MGLQSSTTGSLRRSSTIADEAARWLATLSDSACTQEERRKFAGWLRRSNLHVEEFLRVSALARQLRDPSLWGKESTEELIAAALESRNSVVGLGSPGSAARRSARTRWLMALSVAACALVAVLGFFVKREMAGPGGAVYTTAVGEQRSVVLEDGSIVELNTQSSLRTRFTPAERIVELLRGEAIFKVAHNPQRPFRVLSGKSEIVAVGTAFNVYAHNERTVVTVLEGRVRVRHKDDAATASIAELAENIELSIGEQAVIAPRRPIVRVALDDPGKATAWTERRLIFEETPLGEAAEEFARYYTAKTIRIADPELASKPIDGVFDASDPGALVEYLRTCGEFLQVCEAIDIREDERGWVVVGPLYPNRSFVQMH